MRVAAWYSQRLAPHSRGAAEPAEAAAVVSGRHSRRASGQFASQRAAGGDDQRVGARAFVLVRGYGRAAGCRSGGRRGGNFPPLPLPPLSPLLHVSAPPPVAVDAPASTPPDLTVACCRGACRYTIVCDVCGPNCASRDAAAHASEHAVTHVRRRRGGVALPPAPRMSLDSKPLLSGAAEARASRARLMPLGANQQREIP